MEWQLLITMAIVLACATWLGRSLLVFARGRSSGRCGSCPSSSASDSTACGGCVGKVEQLRQQWEALKRQKAAEGSH